MSRKLMGLHDGKSHRVRDQCGVAVAGQSFLGSRVHVQVDREDKFNIKR
jgi:hypothetical protein